MKFVFGLVALVGLATASIGSAESAQTGSAPVAAAVSSTKVAPALSISPAAVDAVRIVNEFMTALSAGDLAAAQQFLDPSVVVVANSVIYGNRDAYLNGPAKGDAHFLQRAQRQLLRRQARAGNTFAWVISEKMLRSQQDGATMAKVNTETMLLAKTAEGWKIVHINWSSRALAIP